MSQNNRSGPHAKGMTVPSSRIGRLSRLGSMTAGVAGNMAVGGLAQLGRGQRPDWRGLLLTPGNVTRVADQLAKMRGAAMKIGQLVSMDTGDVLPPELSQIMARLRDDAHFMPPAQLKKVLASHWPDGWLKSFERFDVRPVAAASIGQVHRAKLKSGEELAIKVQYPGVARSIDSDVANVGALIRISGLLPKGFPLAPYLDEAARQLHEETDYLREAQYLERFQKLLGADDAFVLAAVHSEWSTGSVLAMDFVNGTAIEEVADLDQETRNEVMLKLINLTLKEMFEFKVMQSDPNFANYRFDRSTKQIVLLDFGAAREIDAVISAAYEMLLRAGLRGDMDEVEDVLVRLCFIDKKMHDEHRLEILSLAQLAFSALRAPTFDFADTALSRTMQTRGEALVRDGFIPPVVPMDVLYLQRKLGGMFLLGARLKAKLPVGDIILSHLSDH